MTLGHLLALAVHSNHLRVGLAHRTPADVFAYVVALDRAHAGRHRLRCAQPVAVIVSRGEIAHAIQIAEHVRHRAESAQTTSGAAQVLAVSSTW